MTVGQFYVERYYARGATRALPPTPFQRLRAGLHHQRVRPQPAISEIPWVRPHD
jgi:polar amino acid transport system permease protein